MSRCFPFPPPGYEKKARSDDADLLNKEKQREKKPKKEKKDKEKREKEKKERDRSDGKHRDKKDKKGKNREKKKEKEKERDKDKDKKTPLEEKRIQSDSHNKEKLNQKENEIDKDKDKNNISDEKKPALLFQGHSGDMPIQNSLFAEEDKNREKEKEKEKERDKDKDKKTTSEEKRVQSDSHNKEKLNQKENEIDKDKDKNNILDEKKPALLFQGHSGDMPIQNCLFAEGTGDFKFVQEWCRRISDEDEGTGSQLVDRPPITEHKNCERNGVVVKDARIMAVGKEKNYEKGVDNRKIDGVAAIFSDRAVVQNLVGLAQNRVQDVPRPSEKQFERQVGEKDKSKEREGEKKHREKRKDKDKEKKSHGKDKEREREKKKEEKARKNCDHKTEDGGKLKDSIKNDQVATLIVRNSYGARDGERNAAADGILKKRKELEANGFLHEADVRPNKKPRPSSYPSTENVRRVEPSHTAGLFTPDDTDARPIKFPKPGPHPSVENGRKLEHSRAPILLTSARQAPSNNLKLDYIEELKVNGVIKSHTLPISSKKSPSPPSSQVEKIVRASTKPPHPDSKYLSLVFSVPKMEELSDFDDQEWLFSSKDYSSEKKPMVASTESPMVWAEAVQIESADIYALPYVIPY